MTKIDVQHDPARRRFFAIVEWQEAFLDYEIVDRDTLDFVRTYTPPPLRGRRIAERIVLHALAYAHARGYGVVPTCWYVQRVLDRRKEKSA
jgi:predicted GNAT family acetyltransferase